MPVVQKAFNGNISWTEPDPSAVDTPTSASLLRWCTRENETQGQKNEIGAKMMFFLDMTSTVRQESESSRYYLVGVELGVAKNFSTPPLWR